MTLDFLHVCSLISEHSISKGKFNKHKGEELSDSSRWAQSMKKSQFSQGHHERRFRERGKQKYVKQEPLEYCGLDKAHSKM